jgi:hypothetical protein
MTRMIPAVDLFSRPIAKALNLVEKELPQLPPHELYLGEAAREFHAKHQFSLGGGLFKDDEASLAHTMIFHLLLHEEGVDEWGELRGLFNGKAVTKAIAGTLPNSPSIEAVLSSPGKTARDTINADRIVLSRQLGKPLDTVANPDEATATFWLQQSIDTIKQLERQGYRLPTVLPDGQIRDGRGNVYAPELIVPQMAQMPIPRLREYA